MEAEEQMIQVFDHILTTSGEDHPLTIAIIAYLAAIRMYCEVSRPLSDRNRFMRGLRGLVERHTVQYGEGLLWFAISMFIKGANCEK
jgi:hypothetical protein